MADIVIVTEQEIRSVVALDGESVACIENGFLALATQPVVMPPILRLDIEEFNGEVDVKTAYVPGIDSFAIKISPGFFDNPKLGLASVNGLMVLFSSKTGLVEAVLLDNGYLTDVRTAAAGAVAARHLSRPDSKRAAIFGAGVQACLQLKALCLVRPIEEAVIWARDPAKADAAARALAEDLDISVVGTSDPEAAVRDADIIVTTTPATTPILSAGWLRPGQHVTAMGSDAETKNELDPNVIAKVDLYVADRVSQTSRLGELHHAIASGAVPEDFPAVELGDIISGQSVGRRDAAQVTLCDLTGTGMQDTAIATFARARLAAMSAGLVINNA